MQIISCDGVREAAQRQPRAEGGSFASLRARGFLAEWWSRLDHYCKGACACQTVEDLAAHVVLEDRAVAVWYSCMSRGLGARKVEGRRVRCWRPSPGAGVNKRKRAAATLAVRLLVPPTDRASQARPSRIAVCASAGIASEDCRGIVSCCREVSARCRPLHRAVEVARLRGALRCGAAICTGSGSS